MWSCDRQGLIVVALLHLQFRAWPDTAVLQKFEESTIALVDSTYRVVRFEGGIGKKGVVRLSYDAGFTMVMTSFSTGSTDYALVLEIAAGIRFRCSNGAAAAN